MRKPKKIKSDKAREKNVVTPASELPFTLETIRELRRQLSGRVIKPIDGLYRFPVFMFTPSHE